MELMQRFSMIFKAKASKTLDRYEDLQETLEMLQKLRRAVADVATSRKRIELQVQQLQQLAAKLDGQAKQAIPRYQFQQSTEQLPQRLLSRLAKSWRARQADILTRHANGGRSNGCTGAITC